MSHKINVQHIKLLGVFAFITMATVVFCSGGSALPAQAQSMTMGPEGGTGAPGEQSCEICHTSFALNSGIGQVSIGAPASYQPGETYQITVKSNSSDPTRLIWGFLLTALTPDNEPAGTLQAGPSTLFETGVGNFPARQYIRFAQNFAGAVGGVSWTFNWTAPVTDQGTVTFYSSFLQGNFDGTDSGDFVYTINQAVPLTVNTPPPPPPPVPVILNASVDGKNLDLMVQSCDSSSVMIVNGVDQDTIFDPDNPSILVGKKTVKKMKIKVGRTATVQVKNADTGQESAEFTFKRTP